MNEPKEQLGTCNYCGQIHFIGCSESDSETQCNKTATYLCDCPDAKHERKIQDQITTSKDRVSKLFGDKSKEYGFAPIENEKTLTMLNNAVENIAYGYAISVTFQLGAGCKAKTTLTPKGKIKVERTDTAKYQLEE